MNVAGTRRTFRHRLAKACLLLLVLCVPAWADWRPAVPEARLVGRGDFTWFGMSLYTARLWSSEAPPAWGQPFALELTYRRALSRDTLVEASLDEMRRLGGASLDDATRRDEFATPKCRRPDVVLALSTLSSSRALLMIGTP